MGEPDAVLLVDPPRTGMSKVALDGAHFAPDGKWVAFLGFEDRGRSNHSARLWVVGMDGRGLKLLGSTMDRNYHSPIWKSSAIFVVEDDRDIAQLVRHHLEGAGFGVRAPAASVSAPARNSASRSIGLSVAESPIRAGRGPPVARTIRSSRSSPSRSSGRSRPITPPLDAPLDAPLGDNIRSMFFDESVKSWITASDYADEASARTAL